MRGEEGWASAEGVKTSRPRRGARANAKSETRRPKAEGNPKAENRSRCVRWWVRKRLFMEVAMVRSDYAGIRYPVNYMISLRRPPVGTLSAAEGVTRAVRPWG